jgi:hypothetical protein
MEEGGVLHNVASGLGRLGGNMLTSAKGVFGGSKGRAIPGNASGADGTIHADSKDSSTSSLELKPPPPPIKSNFTTPVKATSTANADTSSFASRAVVSAFTVIVCPSLCFRADSLRCYYSCCCPFLRPSVHPQPDGPTAGESPSHKRGCPSLRDLSRPWRSGRLRFNGCHPCTDSRCQALTQLFSGFLCNILLH